MMMMMTRTIAVASLAMIAGCSQNQTAEREGSEAVSIQVDSSTTQLQMVTVEANDAVIGFHLPGKWMQVDDDTWQSIDGHRITVWIDDADRSPIPSTHPTVVRRFEADAARGKVWEVTADESGREVLSLIDRQRGVSIRSFHCDGRYISVQAEIDNDTTPETESVLAMAVRSAHRIGDNS